MSHYRRAEKYPDQCDDANEDGILVHNDPRGGRGGGLGLLEEVLASIFLGSIKCLVTERVRGHICCAPLDSRH